MRLVLTRLLPDLLVRRDRPVQQGILEPWAQLGLRDQLGQAEAWVQLARQDPQARLVLLELIQLLRDLQDLRVRLAPQGQQDLQGQQGHQV